MYCPKMAVLYIDGLVQNCGVSVLVMLFSQSCTKPTLSSLCNEIVDVESLWNKISRLRAHYPIIA